MLYSTLIPSFHEQGALPLCEVPAFVSTQFGENYFEEDDVGEIQTKKVLTLKLTQNNIMKIAVPNIMA